MFPPFDNHPGLLFVVATLLPVVSVLILLVVGGVRNFLRHARTLDGPQLIELGTKLLRAFRRDVALLCSGRRRSIPRRHRRQHIA